MCTETGHKQRPGCVEMGGALSIEQLFMAFGIAIAFIEFCSRLCQIDKRNVLFLGQLFHVIGVVHQVVIGRHALLF